MIKVIHIKKCKKCRKMGIFTKLSTLSTPKSGKTGDYSGIEKDRTFCRVIIKMKKNNIRDTPVIVIPKGYTIDDLMDFDDEGYENGEPAMVEEVKVVFEQ